jgi:hypothetical protein
MDRKPSLIQTLDRRGVTRGPAAGGRSRLAGEGSGIAENPLTASRAIAFDPMQAHHRHVAASPRLHA